MSPLHLVSNDILLLALMFIFKDFLQFLLKIKTMKSGRCLFLKKKMFLFAIILSTTDSLCKFILVYIVPTLFDFAHSSNTQCTG